MFPTAWWIRSNILLEVGFLEVLVLAVIPYSFSIGYFLNSWPISYDPWSYMISIGLGYLVNHVVSTMFVIDNTIWSLYCVILNHHVTGSIMVKSFRLSFLSLTFFLLIRILLDIHRVCSIVLLIFLRWKFAIFLSDHFVR